MIPPDIREEVIRIVEQFNKERRASVGNERPSIFSRLLRLGPGRSNDSGPARGDYVLRFRGRFLYLDRVMVRGQRGQICRLTWTGDMNGWEFAIYKHSSNRYDPDEWFFPGAGAVDGTVEGAMRAGLLAYPA